jgi:hypothetical protein
MYNRLSNPPSIFLDAFVAFGQEFMARIIAMGTSQSVERARSLALFSSSTFSFVGYKCTAVAAAVIQAASPTCSLDLEFMNGQHLIVPRFAIHQENSQVLFRQCFSVAVEY